MRFARLLMFLSVCCGLGQLLGEEPVVQVQVTLSDAERAWRTAHPSITIALDDANPPLNFRRPDGSFAGISVDYLHLIADKAGLRLELTGSSWSDALGRAMRHEVDGIMSASYKEERLVALSFTNPYCETPLAVVTAHDHPAIDALTGLAGRRVAVVAGTVRVSLLQSQVPTAVRLEVANSGEGIRALAEGRVDAFFDDLPVIQEQISTMMVGKMRVALLYFQPEAGAQRIGVRKNAPELRAILDQAIASISPTEHRSILDRWLHLANGAAIQRDIGLTEAERAWLSAHPVIRVACDPDWAPVEWRDAAGVWRGISADYLERLQQMLGVRFSIAPVDSWQQAQDRARGGDVDLFASMTDTAERRSDWLFTPSYASIPITIFARSEVGFIHGLAMLDGSRVAVVKGYAEAELLRREHPAIILVEVANIKAGLAQVRNGAVAAYVGGLLPTAYSLQTAGDLSIHVVGETPYSYHQALAVRKDWVEFHTILNKALLTISVDERDALLRRWVAVRYQRSTDYSLMWKLGGPALVAVLVFWLWNRRLRAEVRRRTHAEQELIAYRDRLEILVRDRTIDLESALGRLRRLAAAIEQTAEGVILATPDGRVDFVNPAFTRITGLDQTAVLGLGLEPLGVPWSDAAVRAGCWRGRVVGRRADGSGYELAAAISAVCDAEGRMQDLLLVVRDVTADRLLQERLAQSQKLEAVGTLAGGIAHDFNNILAAILGAMELSDRPGLSAERRQYYHAMVISACERARNLVRQMLTFARATPADASLIELAPIITEALGLLRSSLPTTIDLQSHLTPGLVVMGDPTRLHQIIMNLGTNAGLAMPQGGALVVDLHAVEIDAAFASQHAGLRPGPGARITVRDSGVGMSSQVQERIFEPFFTTRPHGQGTGLGLAVVHGIVRDAGGAITLYSEPGRGTTFTIVLPVVQAATSSVCQPDQLTTGHQERILFVDDEIILCVLAREMLSALNYQVTIANDGEEALALIRQSAVPFDLVITDTTMPRLTGIELIATLRALHPGLPMILTSGQGPDSSATLPSDVRFLAKPITMAELATAIQAALAPR